MRIYIVGYMYSGKTKVGLRLARRLGYGFIDLDAAFEERYKISIPDFFVRYDEKAFRIIEHDMLLSTADFDNYVVATGGGTPCFHSNMDFILDNGLSIFLDASESIVLSRRASAKKTRPLLEKMGPEELRAFVSRQLAERRVFYERADMRFDAENVAVEEICEAVRSKMLQMLN